MAIRMTAVKVVRYGGRRYDKGQSFDATPRHAKVLVAARVAKFHPTKEEKVEKKAEVKTRELKAEKEPKKVETTEAKEPKGGSPVGAQTFERRDMVAKEPK